MAAALSAQGGTAGLDARAKGKPTAPLTLYEMSDFQCPFCRDFTLKTLPTLEREFVATGKIRMIFINFPLPNIHANATAAAEVAMCSAQQHRFWPVHDRFFLRQPVWAPLKNPRAYLIALADSAGVDGKVLGRCLADGSGRAAVAADRDAAAKTGAHSTPTFYIEGALIEGDAPPAVFRQLLDSIYRSKVPSPPAAR